MSSTSVFVDDAVQGHLPGVCAKTGAPASRVLTITEDLTGGLGAAWVLLFFGPLGWLVLAVVALSRRRRSLTVRIPYADEMLETYVRAARRAVHVAIGTGVVLVAIVAAHFGLVLDASATLALGLVALVAGGIAVLVCGALARRLLVRIDLDASGRWVTLGGVHPAFAAACDATQHAETSAAPVRPSVPFSPPR